MPSKGFTHERGSEGVTNVWLTPKHITDALGEFDLDPCAAPSPRPWDIAKKHYDITAEEDGLILPWNGRVWCNPPYGPHAEDWLKLMAQHNQGIALIFARTETKAWQKQVWPKASGILFLAGRIRFCRPDGTPGDSAAAPSALVAYGGKDSDILRSCVLPGAFVRPITR